MSDINADVARFTTELGALIRRHTFIEFTPEKATKIAMKTAIFGVMHVADILQIVNDKSQEGGRSPVAEAAAIELLKTALDRLHSCAGAK